MPRPFRSFLLAALSIVGLIALTLPLVLIARSARPNLIRARARGVPDGTLLRARIAPFGAAPHLPIKSMQAAADYVISLTPRSLSDRLHKWRTATLPLPFASNDRVRTEMGLIFSYGAFKREFPDSAELILPSAFGWRVRQRRRTTSSSGDQTEYHVDQLLATCGEAGVPVDQEIKTSRGSTTLAGLLEGSRRDFVDDQDPMWSLVAYCSYLSAAPEWQNRFGESESYSEIAHRMISEPLAEGPCSGTHKHYALAYLLQADDATEGRCLDHLRRSQVERYLAQSAAALVRSQLPNGAWHRHWAAASPESIYGPAPDSIDKLVLVTGHHVEWVLLCASQLRPPADVTAHACRFLEKAIRLQGREVILNNYCGYSHGARALLMAIQARPSPEKRPGALHALLSPKEINHESAPSEGGRLVAIGFPRVLAGHYRPWRRQPACK